MCCSPQVLPMVARAPFTARRGLEVLAMRWRRPLREGHRAWQEWQCNMQSGSLQLRGTQPACEAQALTPGLFQS